jgi:hypothetical protein
MVGRLVALEVLFAVETCRDLVFQLFLMMRKRRESEELIKNIQKL